MNASERWFRLLLRLYPADFRDEMGGALVETYLHRSHETSVAWVWVVALWDSLRNGVGERMRPAVAPLSWCTPLSIRFCWSLFHTKIRAIYTWSGKAWKMRGRR